jgi:hypothetical protein
LEGNFDIRRRLIVFNWKYLNNNGIKVNQRQETNPCPLKRWQKGLSEAQGHSYQLKIIR